MDDATQSNHCATNSNVTHFKCPSCRHEIEIAIDKMGEKIECANCKQTINVPLHISTLNPFRGPLISFSRKIANIKWHFPYVAQFVEMIVILFVLAFITSLYLTVGIASQIAGMLESLLFDACYESKSRSSVEQSAYILIATIYFILLLPFLLLLLPFTVLSAIAKNPAQSGEGLIKVMQGIGIAIASSLYALFFALKGLLKFIGYVILVVIGTIIFILSDEHLFNRLKEILSLN